MRASEGPGPFAELPRQVYRRRISMEVRTKIGAWGNRTPDQRINSPSLDIYILTNQPLAALAIPLPRLIQSHFGHGQLGAVT